MQVPGRAGYSIIGDESIEFYRTPREYLEKRRRNHGNVFLGRILNKPTVFVTSNRAVQDLLHGMLRCYELETLFSIFALANFVKLAYVTSCQINTAFYDHSHESRLGLSWPSALFIQWTTMAGTIDTIPYHKI